MAPPRRIIHNLEHGIVVIGERVQRGRVYWRIESHPLFPRSTDIDYAFRNSTFEIQRARVIATIKYGRALEANEIVHHIDENKMNDDPVNLELISPADHNRHHKLGAKHSEATKLLISTSLYNSYSEGRRTPTRIASRDVYGRITGTEKQ